MNTHTVQGILRNPHGFNPEKIKEAQLAACDLLDQKKLCKWKDDGWDTNTFETNCGNMFSVMFGRPGENKFKYCPFCGGWLIDVELNESQTDDLHAI